MGTFSRPLILIMLLISTTANSDPMDNWKPVDKVLREFVESKDLVHVEYLGIRCGGLYLALSAAFIKRGATQQFNTYISMANSWMLKSAKAQELIENPNLPNKLSEEERVKATISRANQISNSYIKRMEDNFMRYGSMFMEDDFIKNDMIACTKF